MRTSENRLLGSTNSVNRRPKWSQDRRNKNVRFRYSLENSPKSKVYVWDSVPKPVPKSTSRYSPMLAGFETRFPRAPAFFPPASNLQGRRGGSIDFYVCAHEYSSPLENTLPRRKKVVVEAGVSIHKR